MESLHRHHHHLTGVVQGVGMRPFLATLAKRFELSGWCLNNSASVECEVQGTAANCHAFHQALLTELPPLAHVLTHDTTTREIIPNETGFRILKSERVAKQEVTLISPDISICDACLADMHDSHNRRYRYPFTTCTHCGPRLSIIEDLPYDRPLTTLKHFPLCEDCLREYQDPQDRRYHAQPISCPNCGPKVWLQDATGTILAEGDEIWAAVQQLWDAGNIVAIRGIGGFHLTCDAMLDDAVARLRQRKQRPDKPFALMVPTLAAAETLVNFTPAERELFCSPARPIVVAQAKQEFPSLAPGQKTLGVMLPYSPLHTLVCDRPVVATSGNLSGEPICYTNADALEKLAGFADAFVLHDRGIHVPVEDSVYHHTTLVRRSRGLAPLPLAAPAGNGATVLGVGGELKNTFTLVSGQFAHISGHIGDMGSWAAQQAYDAAVAQMMDIRHARVDRVVCDLHPGYATTKWATDFADTYDCELLMVQHHHAHAVSLLAEHQRLAEPAVILATDGTGYGEDGTIWGGEILLVTPDGQCQRKWHLPTFGLVGGDRAVQYPWRSAAGWAYALGVELPYAKHLEAAEYALVQSQLASGFGVVPTSSAGRRFDAAASILGLCQHATFEAQAAMLLEQIAQQPSCALPVPRNDRELFECLTDQSLAIEHRAWLFHDAVAAQFAHHALDIATTYQVDTVGITGGCAVNPLFVQRVEHHLGRTLLTHQQVPCTDGGLSLGQAVLGRIMQ